MIREYGTKYKRALLLACFYMALMLSPACAPKITPIKSQVPEVTIPAQAAELKPAWEQQLEETLASAKKEDRLVIYTSMEGGVIREIAEAFQKKFGINVETQAGRGPEIIPKILLQQKAGIYTVDIYIGGTDPIVYTLLPSESLIPLKPALFLPEVLSSDLWYGKSLPWVDNEKRWIIQTKGGPEGGEMVINTNIVNERELSSYYDLLQPKWKGKMNFTDPTIPSRGRKWLATVLYYKSLDMEYIKSLAKQELFVTRDKRLQIEWVAKGKHLVSLLNAPSVYYDFLEAGAPLKEIYLAESKEMLGGGSSGLSMMNKSPHPMAARLFVNWYLSKEGQTVFSRAYMYQSFREDVTTDHLLPAKIRKPGKEYRLETEDFLRNQVQYDKFAMETFGPLIK